MTIFKRMKNYFNKLILDLIKEDDFEKDFRRNYSKYSKYYHEKKYY